MDESIESIVRKFKLKSIAALSILSSTTGYVRRGFVIAVNSVGEGRRGGCGLLTGRL